MSRNNTGNPLGSKAFLDFEDNVRNLDQAVNSNELSWRDRLGRDRKSFEGMEREFSADQSRRESEFDADQAVRENEFESAQNSREVRFNDFIAASGYQFLGDYAAGLEFTEYNQLIRDANGEFWRLSGQVDLPYVTTGAGIPEGDALVPMGDAVLRQNLANPLIGAALAARGVVTVDGPSDFLALSASQLRSDLRYMSGGHSYRYKATEKNPTISDGAGGGFVLENRDALGVCAAIGTLRQLQGVSVILGQAFGKLIGGSGNSLYTSIDGNTWTLVQDVGFLTASSQYRVYELGDGEILINTGTELRKSSGWSTPGSKSFTIVQSVATGYAGGSARFHQGWGVRVAGQYVMASEYGTPKPTALRAYLSTDNGSTFTEVFNIADHYSVDASSNAHLHGCCIDIFHGAVPRIWQMTADSGFIGWWYSDDLGVTWDSIPFANFPPGADSSMPPNYVIMIANEYGIVAGTDEPPNGTAVLPRDGDYASNPKIYTAYEFKDGDDQFTTHIASDQAVVGRLVYTILPPAPGRPLPARIIATDPVSREGFLVWEDDGSHGQITVSQIDHWRGRLLVRVELGNVLDIPLYSSSTTRPGIADAGHVLGSDCSADQRSLGVGVNSVARGPYASAIGQYSDARGGATAVGAYAQATGIQSLAVGGTSNPTTGVTEASALNSIAVGPRSAALTDNALAVGASSKAYGGNSATALAYQAEANGASALAVGVLTKAEGTNSTSVGRQAQATSSRATAVGSESGATALRSTAVGANSLASASYGVAIGDNAKAIHQGAIALGRDSLTSDVSQLAIGARSINISALTGVGTPPAGSVSLYVHEAAGETQLRLRLPDGTILKVETVPV